MRMKIIPPVGTLTGLGVVSAGTVGFGCGVTISIGGAGGDMGTGSETGRAVDPGPLRTSSPSPLNIHDVGVIILTRLSMPKGPH